MVLFLTLLIAGIALVAIGAAVDGMLYLMSVGVLLLIADLLGPGGPLHVALASAPGPLKKPSHGGAAGTGSPARWNRARCGGRPDLPWRGLSASPAIHAT